MEFYIAGDSCDGSWLVDPQDGTWIELGRIVSEFVSLDATVDQSCVLVTDGDEYVTMQDRVGIQVVDLNPIAVGRDCDFAHSVFCV